jgi:SPP1 family predicted phage head-tail adaptor
MTHFLQNAGRYRQPITIQQEAVSINQYGENVGAWTTFAQSRASIMPISGKQFINSESIKSEITHQVHLRYMPNITNNMRIQFGTRIFYIIAVINFQEMNKEIQLMCKEYSA